MNEKKSKNIFLIGYIMVMLVMISSCGSSNKIYHVGTGQEMYKSKCGAIFIKR